MHPRVRFRIANNLAQVRARGPRACAYVHLYGAEADKLRSFPDFTPDWLHPQMPDAISWSNTAAPQSAANFSAPPQDEPLDHDALPPGTRLDEFEIVRVLGAGGFGIVYLALDQVLMRQVAIKEYMPSTLAGRGKGTMVSVRSASLVETFALGLESFCNEARMLASFDHPSLVKVHRFWKANGTAYMVMPFYPGQTLKETRRTMLAAPDEAWLRSLVEPLLGALEALHAEGVYHRDIAPDNILLLPDGRPLLLDFGSARRVIGDRTQMLTAILKPNFAPLEQYADDAAMRQGPWTDLYALGATVHFALTGQAPTPAVLRAVRDALPSLASNGTSAYPAVGSVFLEAIDWALTLNPDARPQSAGAMRQALRGEIAVPLPAPRFVTVPRLPPAATHEPQQWTGHTITAPITVPLDKTTEPSRIALPTASKTMELDAGAAAKRSSLKWVVLSAVLLVAVAFAWGLRSKGASSDGVQPSSADAQGATIDAATAGATAKGATPITEPTPVSTTQTAEAEPVPITGVAASGASAKASGPVVRRLRVAEATSASAPVSQVGAVGVCSESNVFSRAACLVRECRLPAFANSPQCIESRRVDELRQHRMEQQ